MSEKTEVMKVMSLPKSLSSKTGIQTEFVINLDDLKYNSALTLRKGGER